MSHPSLRQGPQVRHTMTTAVTRGRPTAEDVARQVDGANSTAAEAGTLSPAGATPTNR